MTYACAGIALCLISIPILLLIGFAVAGAKCEEAREELNFNEEFWRWPPV